MHNPFEFALRVSLADLHPSRIASLPTLQEALALIAANMAEIRADPSAPYNPLVDSLRRSQYKQRSVARRSSRAGTAGSSAARGGRNRRSSSSGSESDECDDSDEGAEEQGGAAR